MIDREQAIIDIIKKRWIKTIGMYFLILICIVHKVYSGDLTQVSARLFPFKNLVIF